MDYGMTNEHQSYLIQKYDYMFAERKRSIKNFNQQQEIDEEILKISKEGKDEILMSQLTEEQKTIQPWYAIAFGLECGDGWFNLIDEMLGKIESVDKDKIADIDQLKEKSGELVLYLKNSTDEMENIIREYAKKSIHVCELCGKPGELCVANKWYQTVCPEHREQESWPGRMRHYVPVSEIKEEE